MSDQNDDLFTEVTLDRFGKDVLGWRKGSRGEYAENELKVLDQKLGRH